MPSLHVHLLGTFRLVYGDEPLTNITAPRQRSLLTYLLLNREAPQSRRHIAFTFWPESTESQARTNLRKLLYALRNELADADRFLQADRSTVQWNPEAPFTLDVAAFEARLDRAARAKEAGDHAAVRAALAEAVDGYGGDLLLGTYEEWLLAERERLRQAYRDALEALTRLCEEQRDDDAAITYAQHLLQHDPLREATYRRLMRLHARNGEPTSALRIYHECKKVLERELGVEPSPPTRRIYERLVQ